MFVLLSLIHVVFLSIFFFFGRYIEMWAIVLVYTFFLSKIITPLDIFHRPAFFLSKTPDNKTLEQSLYLSSGILFYTALIGISLGISDYFNISVDLQLFHYSVFFLTSVIYGIYLLFYPKNPSAFLLFRTHTILAGLIVSGMVLGTLFFGLFYIGITMIINLILLTCGMAIVIILDRTIPKNTHILTVYFFVFYSCMLVLALLSFARPEVSTSVFFVVATLATLYLIFPFFLSKIVKDGYLKILSWHFSNFVLGISWACFFYFSWALFLSPEYSHLVTYVGFLLLFALWAWVYASEDHNPIFFSGMLIVVSTLYSYLLFSSGLFLEFWVITICLFIFAGLLLLSSMNYKNKTEELILAGGSVIFLCVADLVMIFQDYGLFQLSILFFFQSFLWYGAYEIFHRQSYVKNAAL